MPKVDAFLCHVSKLDGELAGRLKRSLEKLGRKKGQPVALNVFLDKQSVGAGTLPPQLKEALSASRFFVVLVRPELTSRPWCIQEINDWLAGSGISERLLLIHTAGSDLRYSNGKLNFTNPEETLPMGIASAFASEPSWIDLRKPPPYESDDWWLQVGKLAAPIHQCSPGELFSLQIAEQKRVLQRARAAIGALVALSIGLLTALWAANDARQRAQAQTRVSTQRGLAAEAMLEMPRDPVTATATLLKAVDADPGHFQSELEAALAEGVQRARLVKRLEPPMGSFGAVRAMTFSIDGTRLLIAGDTVALILNEKGHAISRAITFDSVPLGANGACALTSGGFVIGYGHRVGALLVNAGVMWLDSDGVLLRNLAVDAEVISVACHNNRVAVGTDRGNMLVGELSQSTLTVARSFGSEHAINAVVWRDGEFHPIVSNISRGSGGQTVLQSPYQRSSKFDSSDIKAHPNNVLAAVDYADGVALSTQSGYIQLLEQERRNSGWTTNSSLAFNGHHGPVWSLLRVGDALVSAGEDRRIKIWLEEGEALLDLAGHNGPVTALAWNEKKRQLFSADSVGAVLVWDLPELAEPNDELPLGWDPVTQTFVERDKVAPKVRQQLPEFFNFDSEKLSIRGEHLYWINDDDNDRPHLRVGTWRASKLKTLHLRDDLPISLLPRADGSLLIGGGYLAGLLRIKSVDASLQALQKDYPKLAPANPQKPPGLHLFANTKLIYSRPGAHDDSILTLAERAGPGRVRFASGGADGKIKLWDSTLERVDEFRLFSDVESTIVLALAFSADGHVLYAAVSTDASVPGSGRGWVLAFSVDGGELVWRHDYSRDIPIALTTLRAGRLLVHTRRQDSISSDKIIDKLFVIGADGSSNRSLAGQLVAPLYAVGEDARGRVHAADFEGRRFRFPVLPEALAETLRSRQKFHRAHDQALAHATRAERFLEQGNRAAATKSWRNGLRHEPSSTEIRMRLANLLMRAATTQKEALKLYDAVITDIPKMTLPRYQRGRLLLKIGRYAAAEADFTVAIDNGSEVFQPMRIVQTPGAMAELNAVVAQAQVTARMAQKLELLELRALCRLQQGNTAGARQDAQAALRAGRDTAEIRGIITNTEAVIE